MLLYGSFCRNAEGYSSDTRERFANDMKKKIACQRLLCIAIMMLLAFSSVACGNEAIPVQADPANYVEPTGTGSRDNTSICLKPEAPGTLTIGNELVTIDISNSSEGYFIVEYAGECTKVKLQITCPNTTTYTYNLSSGTDVFPLTKDSGSYKFSVFENIEGTQYSTIFSEEAEINISNSMGPYLYPNQYVNFSAASPCVEKAKELATPCNNDLEVVSNIYNHVINTVTYDYKKAETVQSGYLPNPDDTLATHTGICLDYACLMASMLRSQRIPTHMEVGYAGEVYHAWISTYIQDIGWVNGIIQFDGVNWSLMDPTFASSTDAKELKKFIGDGSNYSVKYIY